MQTVSSSPGASRIQSLIEAAERLSEERRHTGLTVAQLAQAAGMPEHLARDIMPSERAMVDALADNAMRHLLDPISRRTTATAGAGPRKRVEAIAHGFLDWAISRPAEFLLISDRHLFDPHSTAPLRRLNDSIRDLLHRSLAEAQREGYLDARHDLDLLAVTGRALVYGLARMVTDGHLPEWSPTEAAEARGVAERSLQTYLDAIFVTPPAKYA